MLVPVLNWYKLEQRPGIAGSFRCVSGGSLAHGGGLLLLREVVPVDDGVVYRHSTSLSNGYRQVGRTDGILVVFVGSYSQQSRLPEQRREVAAMPL